MSEHDAQIERIKYKLARAARVPRKSQKALLDQDDIANYELFFGADRHRFQVNPPMPLADIEAWEAAYDMTLPSGYRTFLEHIGNGGEGPYYGIVPLDIVSTSGPLDRHALQKAFPVHGLRTPPPSLNAVEREAVKTHFHQPCLLVDRPYQLDEDPETWLIEIAGADWEAKAAAGWTPDGGTMEICNHGGAQDDYLVMTGPLRGRVVFREELHPPFVYPGRFLDWYEAWLDDILGTKTPNVP